MEDLILKRLFLIRHGDKYYSLVKLSYASQPDIEFWKPIKFLLDAYDCSEHFIKPFVHKQGFSFLVNSLLMNDKLERKTPWFMISEGVRMDLSQLHEYFEDAFMMAPSYKRLEPNGIIISCQDNQTGEISDYENITYYAVNKNLANHSFLIENEKNIDRHMVKMFYVIAYGNNRFLNYDHVPGDTSNDYYNHDTALRFKTEDDALEYCDRHKSDIGDQPYEIKRLRRRTII